MSARCLPTRNRPSRRNQVPPDLNSRDNTTETDLLRSVKKMVSAGSTVALPSQWATKAAAVAPIHANGGEHQRFAQSEPNGVTLYLSGMGVLAERFGQLGGPQRWA